MKRFFYGTSAVLALFATGALAQDPHAGHHPTPPKQQAGKPTPKMDKGMGMCDCCCMKDSKMSGGMGMMGKGGMMGGKMGKGGKMHHEATPSPAPKKDAPK